MIDFFFETEFNLENKIKYVNWITSIIRFEKSTCGKINFIFCDDAYLLPINQHYLNHDTFTDIITFDYSEGQMISGDIFISVERVRYNASKYEVDFDEELIRVMSHGVLHLLGYKDKTEEESTLMRNKENEKIKMFHVEQ